MELERQGILRATLHRLVSQGRIVRLARGIYDMPGREGGEAADLVMASKRVPEGVMCLISALSFHEIGTQIPSGVWIAIDGKARRPRGGFPSLHVVRFGPRARSEGVETHRIRGHRVRVTSPARTIADCFKYRNKVGLNVALEALREGWRDRRFTMDDLYRAARLDRVDRVMQPYLEAIVWCRR